MAAKPWLTPAEADAWGPEYRKGHGLKMSLYLSFDMLKRLHTFAQTLPAYRFRSRSHLIDHVLRVGLATLEKQDPRDV